jgi:hypothetical protein
MTIEELERLEFLYDLYEDPFNCLSEKVRSRAGLEAIAHRLNWSVHWAEGLNLYAESNGSGYKLKIVNQTTGEHAFLAFGVLERYAEGIKLRVYPLGYAKIINTVHDLFKNELTEKEQIRLLSR